MSEEIPKLRLAPLETLERYSERIEKENRARSMLREDYLSNAPAKFRIGSVPYLNAVPLTRGLEDKIQFIPPSQLAIRLRAGELQAGLVSVTEVLFNDLYDILDGISVASLGEVKSVFLAHRQSLEQIQTIYCDPASLTSVVLCKILLLERGLKPEFVTLGSYSEAPAKENVLLIGDAALQFSREKHPHQIFDLGAAWYELTKLPFVYAVWALRRDFPNKELRLQLKEARDFGLDTLETIIRDRPEFDYDLRKDYLSWHIHYHLGSDEKRGLAKFVELLRKHNLGAVFDPTFVP